MSFINFESAAEKEKIRDKLRDVRKELLKRAQRDAEKRAQKYALKKLCGDDQWIHPSVEKKLSPNIMTVKKPKKTVKRLNKQKKSKTQRKKHSEKRKSFSSDSSSSNTDAKSSAKKRKRQETHKSSGSSSSADCERSDDGDEWVEKASPAASERKEPDIHVLKRDDWMTAGLVLQTYSKPKHSTQVNEEGIGNYDPTKSIRELNPHWKDGGTGLPAFQKPKDDYDDKSSNNWHARSYKISGGNWRKKIDKSEEASVKSFRNDPEIRDGRERSTESNFRSFLCQSSSASKELKPGKPLVLSFLTDQQMNELGAKLIKAEILGNENLAEELKDKLEKARLVRKKIRSEHKEHLEESAGTFTNTRHDLRDQDQKAEDIVLLVKTDRHGNSRPIPKSASVPSPNSWGGRQANRRSKGAKVETHSQGERIRFFPDDDRYDIKQMFEREKYVSAHESEAQFAEIAGKHKNSKDDLEDIFADQVRKKILDSEADEKEKQKLIMQNERLSKTLTYCNKCLDSDKMDKRLIISMGTKVYLTLPWYEGLQQGHCLIVPVQHVACSTLLDEDVWNEVTDFQKALTRMYTERSQNVIFFETVLYIKRRPHMTIHCVPSKDFEQAPFYFKKAIEESEQLWSTNKQLVQLKDRNIRHSIPRGLPYFWCHFGTKEGFAHVIEDQERFPNNFAEEIIGGLLNLDTKKWRRPRKENNPIQRVKQFADWWKRYDCTQ